MTKKSSGNSLKAVLQRASAADAADVGDAVEGRPTAAPRRRPIGSAATTATGNAVKPSRVGTKMIAGHFPIEISDQLKILAIEEGTTLQSLLSEAVADLLIKKAGRKVRR